jgi:hypothetical protein
MPAAIPLVMVGASMVKGAMDSHAAKKAAKTQTAAGQQALGVQNRVYQDQMAGMAPYAQTGGAANSLMGRLMTAPGGSQFASQGPMSGPAAAPLSSGFASALSGPQGPTMGPQGLMQTGGGQMIQLRAPDGSMGSVPAHLADQFIAKGAQRVG